MPTFFEWIGIILNEYGSLFLKGTGLTLAVALTGTVLGFMLGLLVAVVRTIPMPEKGFLKKALLKAAHLLMSVYIEVFRGTPMIVQAMVIYYGAMQFMNIRMSSLTAGILIVSINTGAYMAEILRGGIISVDKGQKEAATAIGMTHRQAMICVVLPQAIRNIMPSIGNEFVVNIKDSSVLNVISVSELFFMSKSAASSYFRYFEVFTITAVIYLALTLSVTRLLRLIEKKMDGKDSYTISGSQTHSLSAIKVKEEG